MKKKYVFLNGNILFSVFLLILGIIFFVASFEINSGIMQVDGSVLLPRVVSFLWLVFAFVVLIDSLKNANNSSEKKGDQGGFLLTLGLLIFFLFLLILIGFKFASIAYLFLQILVYTPRTKRNYLGITVVSVVLPLIIYWVFNSVFGLLLPKGILF